MAEPQGPNPSPSRWRGCGRLGLRALSLSLLALVVAHLEPGAPESFLGTAAGLALFSLVILATGAAILSRLVERSRGGRPVSEALTLVERSKTRFELALVAALVGLGSIALLAAGLEETSSDLLLRGWFVLLIGGAVVGLAASLAANVIVLLLPGGR